MVTLIDIKIIFKMSKIVFGVKSDYLLHSEYLPVSVKDYKPKWYTDIKPTKIFNVFEQFQNAKTAKSCPIHTSL